MITHLFKTLLIFIFFVGVTSQTYSTGIPPAEQPLNRFLTVRVDDNLKDSLFYVEIMVQSTHSENGGNTTKQHVSANYPFCMVLRDIDFQWLGMEMDYIENAEDYHNIDWLVRSPTKKTCQNLPKTDVNRDDYNRCGTENILHNSNHFVLEIYRETKEASTTPSEASKDSNLIHKIATVLSQKPQTTTQQQQPAWNYRLVSTEEPPPAKSDCRAMPYPFLSYFY